MTMPDPDHLLRICPAALEVRNWSDAAYALLEAVEALKGIVDDDATVNYAPLMVAAAHAREAWRRMIPGSAGAAGKKAVREFTDQGERKLT